MWRAMVPDDLPAVSEISDAVHGKYSEQMDIYAERLKLYPHGCRVFVPEGQPDIAGYLISHPWTRGDIVPLNDLIFALPVKADEFYLHDLALHPAARGVGAGRAALDCVISCAQAEGLSNIALIAVSGAETFWQRLGFRIVEEDWVADKLGSYGAEAVYMERAAG